MGNHVAYVEKHKMVRILAINAKSHVMPYVVLVQKETKGMELV